MRGKEYGIGKIHLKKGDEKKAIEAFNQIIKFNPEKATEVAEELLSSGKPDLAEKMFRKSLENDIDNVAIYNRLGIALRRQGKWQEAIWEYERAVKVDPSNEALIFNMAKAYLEGKDSRTALKFFNRVLTINPTMEEAKKEIEALKKILGDSGVLASEN
jgi:tetratricopeptide (TPR) repeat protein